MTKTKATKKGGSKISEEDAAGVGMTDRGQEGGSSSPALPPALALTQALFLHYSLDSNQASLARSSCCETYSAHVSTHADTFSSQIKKQPLSLIMNLIKSCTRCGLVLNAAELCYEWKVIGWHEVFGIVDSGWSQSGALSEASCWIWGLDFFSWSPHGCSLWLQHSVITNLK